jgi:membrane protease YdiL (CAAX protease family)
MKELLWRAFDYKRIANKRWYVPTLFLAPFLIIVALGIAIFMGLPLVDALFPLVAAPVMLLLFFGGALGEEVGWMGYAFEPMQDQRSAAKAALLLGLIVTLWHVPLYYFVITDPVVLAAQLLFPLMLRILLVWIFNNTGQSVFATILFHTMNNAAFAVLPVNTIVSTLVFAVAAIIVTLLWGPETMAKFRWKSNANV